MGVRGWLGFLSGKGVSAVGMKDDRGRTALDVAAASRDREGVVRFLLGGKAGCGGSDSVVGARTEDESLASPAAAEC